MPVHNIDITVIFTGIAYGRDKRPLTELRRLPAGTHR